MQNLLDWTAPSDPTKGVVAVTVVAAAAVVEVAGAAVADLVSNAPRQR